MSFFNILKQEFSGLKKIETAMLIFVFLVILINAYCVKDGIVAIISAICGIMYTFYAGKGRVLCYFFGLAGSSCYSYLAFKSGLYGNVVLYMFYYIPMQILGIFQWRKNLKKNSREIVKKCLSKKEYYITSSLAIITTILTILILYKVGGKAPITDGITTIFSIVGMYLTVRRLFEQWIVWFIVNFLSLIMWINVLITTDAKVYATAIMWATYLLLSVYFLFEWKKEINE